MYVANAVLLTSIGLCLCNCTEIDEASGLCTKCKPDTGLPPTCCPQERKKVVAMFYHLLAMGVCVMSKMITTAV